MMKLFDCSCSEAWSKWGHVILRVVVGIIFAYHGWQKISVMGMSNVAGFFAMIHIPLPGLFAPVVAYVEFLGGIAIALGLLTHWIAKLNIVIMLVAIFTVHFQNGFAIDLSQGKYGYEFALLLLACNIYLMTKGSGALSLDSKLKKNDAMPQN